MASIHKKSARAFRIIVCSVERCCVVSHAGDLAAGCAGVRDGRRSPLEGATPELWGILPANQGARSVQPGCGIAAVICANLLPRLYRVSFYFVCQAVF